MADKPYTIVVDGAGAVTERTLGDHVAGAVLQPTVRVVSNTVSGGRRTVVMQRPLAGASAAHHSFDPQQACLYYSYYWFPLTSTPHV